MTKTKETQNLTYQVTGEYEFPWDMLRYDEVAPTYPDQRIVAEDRFGGERSVEVRGAWCSPFRWASFGWVVEKSTVEARKPWRHWQFRFHGSSTQEAVWLNADERRPST